ncbi:hypothetical protein ABZ851_30390 [Streptomyces sp. NPDC047049]|uniref:hypothetical protein n=1 Tax=Streptomyces sp. NPDC047049 TaxID=3156688 RepID=UPI0033DF4EF5
MRKRISHIRAALGGAARLRARRHTAAPAGPDLASAALEVVQTVQRLLTEHGGADFYEAVQEALVARGFPPHPSSERCAIAPCSCDAAALDDLVDVLGALGVRGAVRSAVELFDTYGDPNDVLSTTQVDQLCAAAAHFDTE